MSPWPPATTSPWYGCAGLPGIAPTKDFVDHTIEVDGQKHSYLLREGWVNLGVGLRMRSVVRLKDGHQTHVLTTDKESAPAVRLAVEHKHFMNIVKMAVYRAESGLLRMLDEHYRRNDQEGRALLRAAFRSCGALEVRQGVLRVTLDPLSEPRCSRAIAALCSELNDTRTRLPGTSLRLEFAVRDGAET